MIRVKIESLLMLLLRWSEVPQKVFEMRVMQPKAGLQLCCHCGPEAVLHPLYEEEQNPGESQDLPGHQSYRSFRRERMPKVVLSTIQAAMFPSTFFVWSLLLTTELRIF